MRQWKCTVCGYVHKGDAPPDKCPVCGADKSLFVEIAAAAEALPEKPAKRPETAGTEPAPRQWRCTVCGYIHKGDAPPDKCPVCGADKSLFEPMAAEAKPPRTIAAKPAEPEAPLAAPAEPATAEPAPEPALAETLGRYLVKLHAHPISVHIPNGVLPLSVLFMILALVFECASFSTAARYNLVVVMLAMPAVLFTGYNDWKRRFGGHLTSLFLTKIVCGAGVAVLTLILSVWWMVDPDILMTATVGRRLFLFLCLIAMGAAVVAGYMGGKLVFPNTEE